MNQVAGLEAGVLPHQGPCHFDILPVHGPDLVHTPVNQRPGVVESGKPSGPQVVVKQLLQDLRRSDEAVVTAP